MYGRASLDQHRVKAPPDQFGLSSGYSQSPKLAGSGSAAFGIRRVTTDIQRDGRKVSICPAAWKAQDQLGSSHRQTL
jgi:hypothetical protein